MTPKTIPVSEVFGPTLQGEGALAGQPTYFARIGGCDYSCAWCDTAKAVLAENVRKLPRLTNEAIFNQVIELPPGPQWLTISGGNPALYDLSRLVYLWQHFVTNEGEGGPNGKVAVETQGSKWQPWLADVDLLTISPKGPSSGLATQKSMINLYEFTEDLRAAGYREPSLAGGRQAVLKVVVFDEADYEFARTVHNAYPELPFYLSVGTAMGGLNGTWLPPVIDAPGYDKFDHVRAEPVIERGKGSLVLESYWTQRAYTDDAASHARRWAWVADQMKGDSAMADVSLFPQMHALIWGFQTQGV